MSAAARLARPAARDREAPDAAVARDPSVRSRGEALPHPAVPVTAGHGAGSRPYRTGRRRAARPAGVHGTAPAGAVSPVTSHVPEGTRVRAPAARTRDVTTARASARGKGEA